MKNWCAWCLHPIKNTPEKYLRDGNICAGCSHRIHQVISRQITKDMADDELQYQRLINLEKFGDPTKKYEK
jgi:hypothetical protein